MYDYLNYSGTYYGEIIDGVILVRDVGLEVIW